MEKVSIITVCRNAKTDLERTIKSVQTQTAKNIEFIIVDGASTDGTVDLIQKNNSIISKWVSEPDTGIYNAMNKGISLSSGEYCIFMNAGDVFFDNRVLSKFISCQPTEDILSGKELCSKDRQKFIAYRNPPTEINLAYFFKHTLAHQATFIKRELLVRRPYRENYKIASDFIFFYEAFFEESATYRRLDFYVSIFTMDGISSTNGELSQEERIKYFRTKYPQRVVDELIAIGEKNDVLRRQDEKHLAGKIQRLTTSVFRKIDILKDKFTIMSANRRYY